MYGVYHNGVGLSVERCILSPSYSLIGLTSKILASHWMMYKSSSIIWDDLDVVREGHGVNLCAFER